MPFIPPHASCTYIQALDDVCPSTTTDPARVTEAMHRTIRWIDRCIKAHSRPHEQNLYGIIQGGLDPELRAQCLVEMMKRDASLPGYVAGNVDGHDVCGCTFELDWMLT